MKDFVPLLPLLKMQLIFLSKMKEKNDVNRFGAAMFCQQILVPRS